MIMSQVLVLVAADDPDFRTSLVFALEAEEFRVAVADIARFDVFAGDAQDAACVVIDHRPVGADGLDLLEGLRARGVATPAIVISTSNNSGFRRRIAAAGGEWIEKPLLSDALIATVRRIAAPSG